MAIPAPSQTNHLIHKLKWERDLYHRKYMESKERNGELVKRMNTIGQAWNDKHALLARIGEL